VNIWTSEEGGKENLIKLHNVQLHSLCVLSNGGDHVKENQMGRKCSRHDISGRLRLKRDGTRAETRFLLSQKRTSPFKSARVSVQSTAGSRVVRISVSNAGYTTFRGSVKSTGYPLHSAVSPSLPLPCVAVCHQVSNALYIPTFFSENLTGTNMPITGSFHSRF